MNHVIEQPRLGGRTQPNPVEESGTVPANGTYDDPKRSDKCKQVPTFMSKTKAIKIATFNTRTIRENWRVEELEHHAGKQGIEIVGIQEHRIVHEDSIRYKQLDKYHLITSSAWRNSAQAAVGGVGVLISKKAEKALSSVKPISDRILKATFQGNPATTIIVAYSPTNTGNGSEEINKFYEDLRGAIDSSPPHNMTIILGDMNAKLGPEHSRFPFHDKTNQNGQMLSDFVLEKNMQITNTQFSKRMGKRWTFTDPKGEHHQLDYIMVNTKWRNSVRNVEPYSSFASVGSDHRIVTMRLKLSLRAPNAAATRASFEWRLLRNDKNLQTLYSVEIRNRFSSLQAEGSTATEKYKAFTEANEQTAKAILPAREKGRKERHAHNTEVIAARKQMTMATKQYEISKSRAKRKDMNDAKAKLKLVYSKLEEAELKKQIDEAKAARAANQHSKCWKIINKISERKVAPRGKLSGESEEDRRKQWFDHFNNLLGKPAPYNDVQNTPIEQVVSGEDICDGPFTMEEYLAAKKSITEGKAAGEDGVMPEVIKRCNIDDIILGFCNDILIKDEKPEQLSILNIIPLPKKGDLSITGNYRGISLTSIVSKLFNRLILNRVRPVIDPHLRPNQNGFRPGRTTIAQILSLRRIIEGVKHKQLPAVLVFIDFCKAFDSVNQPMMFEILKAYGFPEHIMRAVITMYTGVKAKVISPDGDTDYFNITTGVLQGDTLAPYLFVIVLDFALRKAIDGREEDFGFTLERRRSRRHPAKVITDLDFAVYIALTSDRVDQAKKMLDVVEAECAKVGLLLNAAKTKFMTYNIDEDVSMNSLDGTPIERALTKTGEQDFCYLGGWIDSSKRDFEVRKAIAWKSLHKMKPVWESDLPRNMKIDLFKATTEYILVYGATTWTLTKREEKALDGCYTRMLRMALNISWRQHITNEVLYGDLPKISEVIRENRLGLAGHSYRDNKSPVSQLILWEPVHGRAGRGKPARRYTQQLLEDTGLEALSELGLCMEDRNAWRDFVSRRPP